MRRVMQLCFAVAMVAGALMLLPRPAHATPIDLTLDSTDPTSDTVTVRVGGLNETKSFPEIANSGEDKLGFIFPKGKPLNFGYVLLCEGVANCGPNAPKPFTNVSDFLLSGVAPGAGGKAALFFFSDPFSAGFVKGTVSGTTFLGQIKENGAAQDVSKFFGVPAGSVVVTSDLNPVPEPSSLILLATAIAGLLGYGSRWKSRCTGWPADSVFC